MVRTRGGRNNVVQQGGRGGQPQPQQVNRGVHVPARGRPMRFYNRFGAGDWVLLAIIIGVIFSSGFFFKELWDYLMPEQTYWEQNVKPVLEKGKEWWNEKDNPAFFDDDF